VFIHGPDLLIDTPEEIRLQLNRSSVTRIGACTYSHWHPDHTSGKRVFEMNKDWLSLPPQNSTTRVVVTQRVAQTFGQFLGLQAHFDFLATGGLIDLRVVGNDEAFAVGDYTVTPVQLGQDFSFGFDVAGGGKRLLVVMDELKGWNPGPAVLGASYDLVYLPLGIVDVHPVTGRRTVAEHHPILAQENTLAETLEYVRRLPSSRFVLSHVEEPDGISYEVGIELGRQCSQATGKVVEVAYDTLRVEV